MSRRFRVAVIGAGIGAAHVDAYFANAALYQVAVVCDLDAARAGKVAASAGASRRDVICCRAASRRYRPDRHLPAAFPAFRSD